MFLEAGVPLPRACHSPGTPPPHQAGKTNWPQGGGGRGSEQADPTGPEGRPRGGRGLGGLYVSSEYRALNGTPAPWPPSGLAQEEGKETLQRETRGLGGTGQ